MWPGFKSEDNLINATLSMKYHVVIDEQNPDIIFCNNTPYAPDNGVTEPFRGKSKIVYWYSEALERMGDPNYDLCDFSITSCKYEHERNVRVPLWSLYIKWFECQKEYDPSRNQALLLPPKQLLKPKNKHSKTKFCCLLTNNDTAFKGIGYPRFLEFSHAHNLVTESRGNAFRNMPPIGDNGYDEKSKLEYIQDFKFNLCYDNSENRGWITEKMIHPMSVGVIPIYWGAVDAAEEFNEEAFIHVRQFDNLDKLHEKVLEIHNNDDMFYSIQTQPIFPNNTMPPCGTPEVIIEGLQRIVEA